MSAYDLWKFHDDREDFDDTHCPHGESWGDPCNECWSAREARGKMQRTKRMTALIQSCAKWRMPHKISIGPASCPLCVLYFNKPNCKGCHVRKATGYERCIGTPYPEYAKSLYNGRSDDNLRLKEYQFLRGLWKKEKAKCQTSN